MQQMQLDRRRNCGLQRSGRQHECMSSVACRGDRAGWGHQITREGSNKAGSQPDMWTGSWKIHRLTTEKTCRQAS